MAGQIHRQKKNRDFVTIDTHCLRNPSLKWDAKGLHSYLMQLPDDWKINISDLEKRSANGRDATASPLKSLIDAGYVYRERIHNDKGLFEGYDYHLFERPEHTKGWLSVNGKTVNGSSVNGKPATTKDDTPTELSKDDLREGNEEKNSLPPAEISTLEAETLEGDNLPGGVLAEIHDGETGATVYDLIPPAPVTAPPAHRIELGDRPTFSGRDAQTPVELQTALRAFYADWPNEWSVGVLENGRGGRYSVEQRGEIVKDFCCWAVKNNQQRDTYRQLNAALQNWFRNEQHSTWKQSKPGQNGNTEKPIYERPKNAIY